MVYSQPRNIFVKRDVKLTEPPDAEPHVRWCERSAAKAVSYSIDELVDVEPPQDMLSFCDDLERAIEQFPPEYDDERCLDAVTKLFRHYCKRCYTDKDIIFFDDYTLLEVLEKAKNKSNWDKKFERYKKAKEAFLKIK